MNKSLIFFLVTVTSVSIIVSIFLLCHVLRRKYMNVQNDTRIQANNRNKDVRLWTFMIVFGLLFSLIPVTGLVIQTVRTRAWIEIPAVISEMRTYKSGSDRMQYVYVSYEYNGQMYDHIPTNTSIRQQGVKNPLKEGQQIDILVNPDSPDQISAFNYVFTGIMLILILIGVLLSMTGIIQLNRTLAGKSKWRSAGEPPVILTEEEERKSRIHGKIAVIVIIAGMLFFLYFVFSTGVFLAFTAWLCFLVIYGQWAKHRKNKQAGKTEHNIYEEK